MGQQKLPVLFLILVLHPCLQDLKEPLEAPRGLDPLPLHPFVGPVQFCLSKQSLTVQTARLS